jgi:hypothetical protein
MMTGPADERTGRLATLSGAGQASCRPDYLLPLEFVPDVSAIATGSRPTGMGLSRVPVAIWIGVTVPGPELAESVT